MKWLGRLILLLVVLFLLKGVSDIFGAYIIANGDSFHGFNFQVYYLQLFYTWLAHINGGAVSFYMPNIYAFFPVYFLNFFGLSTTSVISVVFVLLSIWYISYLFVKDVLQFDELSLNLKIILIALASYSISNEQIRVLLISVNSALWGILFTLLASIFYIKALRSQNQKYSYVILVVLFFNLSFIDPSMPIISGLLIMFFSLYFLVISLINKQYNRILYLLLFNTIFLGAFIFTNFYIITNLIPSIFAKTHFSNSFLGDRGSTDLILEYISSLSSVAMSFFLTRNNFYQSDLYPISFKFFDLISSFSLFILSCSSIFWMIKERKGRRITLIALYLAFLFFLSLGIGPKNPLGVFTFFWDNVPGFKVFRDFYKFHRILVFLYIILSFYSLVNIFNAIKSTKKKGFLVVIIVIFGFTKFIPYLFYYPAFKPYKIPEYYFETANFLGGRKLDFHTTILPVLTSAQVYDWSNQDYNMSEPFTLISKKPIYTNLVKYTQDPIQDSNSNMDFTKNLDFVSDFSRFASIKNIHYFVVRNDFSSGFYNDNKFMNSIITNLNDITEEKTFSYDEDNFAYVTHFGDLHIFQISKDHYLSHFYSPKKIYVGHVSPGYEDRFFSDEHYLPKMTFFYVDRYTNKGLFDSLSPDSYDTYVQLCNNEKTGVEQNISDGGMTAKCINELELHDRHDRTYTLYRQLNGNDIYVILRYDSKKNRIDVLLPDHTINVNNQLIETETKPLFSIEASIGDIINFNGDYHVVENDLAKIFNIAHYDGNISLIRLHKRVGDPYDIKESAIKEIVHDPFDYKNFNQRVAISDDIVLNTGQNRFVYETNCEDVHCDADDIVKHNNFAYYLRSNTNAITKNTPQIEFKKINATKYRIVLHDARGVFPLVFSESFHNDWKVYLSDVSRYHVDSNLFGAYKILDGNADDQASEKELSDYIKQEWISTLGDGKKGMIKHKKWENNREKIDYTEQYVIDFISKNFNGTIQNDNLPSGSVFETWFQKPLDAPHLVANGYANSWVIGVDALCKDNTACHQNKNGSYDVELVVEFGPQRLFYIGLAISSMSLVGCLGYIGWQWRKKLVEMYRK